MATRRQTTTSRQVRPQAESPIDTMEIAREIKELKDLLQAANIRFQTVETLNSKIKEMDHQIEDLKKKLPRYDKTIKT